MKEYSDEKNDVLEGTNYSVQFIVKHLKEKNEEFRNLVKDGISSFEVQNMSGIGYLSFILKITFHLNNNQNPFPLIIKVPTDEIVRKNFKVSSDEAKQEEFKNKKNDQSTFPQFLTKAHNRECFFYEEIAPLLQNIKVPKCYGTQERNEFNQGFILMEDISDHAVLQNIIQGMSYEQLKSVVAEIAILHADSRLLSETVFDKLKLNNVVKASTESFQHIFKCGSSVIQKYEKDLWDSYNLGSHAPPESHLKYNIPPVLCHADIWANNIFFEKDKNGKANDKVYGFLDWQLIYRGNGMSDLVRLLNISVDAEIRKKHRMDLLQLYLDTLNSKLKDFGLDSSYTLDLIVEMYVEHSKYEIVFSSMLLLNYYFHLKDEKTKERIMKRIEEAVQFTFSGSS